jgi:hypothetical protein
MFFLFWQLAEISRQPENDQVMLKIAEVIPQNPFASSLNWQSNEIFLLFLV